MKHRIILLAIAALAAFEAAAARPRLVVNIVVGSMRAEDLGRYAGNYGEGGLRRLLDGGTVFADSRYDYQQTTTPVSLATLTTGAMPSTHGVIGARWRDYVENDAVELIAGRKGPGPYNLIAPTLAEALLQHEPGAKAVSVATEAMSAVIMAGHSGEAFWLDSARCGWETSPYYAPEVPEWVARSNRERYNLSYITPEWRTLYEKGRYLNTRNWDIVLTGKSRKDKDEPGEGRLKLTSDYDKMLYTPAGNTAVLGFAKQAIAQFKLGDDATPDLLNICLDTPRRISEAYGPESVEVEDMYYRLDRDLADFLTFVFAQVRNGEVLVVFDVDDFKQVNDCYGHLKGDICLAEIAACIKKAYAHYGFCYRTGGDEFCVLLKDEESEARCAKTMQALLAERRKVFAILPTVSLGSAVFSGEDVVEVKDRADRALYCAKKEQKARAAAAKPADSREKD